MSQTLLLPPQVRKSSAASGHSSPARVRVRTVALPTEHGGWSLALEPIVLGLLVAPSSAGLFLAVATMGTFLARHPFKIVMVDRRRGRRFPRTALAETFLLIYGLIALLFILAASATAVSYAFLIPLVLAIPLASIQLAFDSIGRSRGLAPELAGTFGLASVSASIALATGWPVTTSLALWVVLAARSVPAMIYVRTRILELHGETPSVLPALIAHAVAQLVVLSLLIVNAAPLVAILAISVLTIRAVSGLSENSQTTTAKQIGIREVVFGVVTVLTIAAGYLFDW